MPKAAQNKNELKIPQFSLYGESAHRSLLDFVHIEEIHVRSAKNDWIIKPHRHNTLFQILLVRSGNTRILLDDKTQVMQGACMITLPVGVVHGFQFQPRTEGFVLSLAINHQGLDADNQLAALFHDDMANAHIVELEDNDLMFVWNCLDQIQFELDSPKRDQAQALFSLVKLVLIHMRRHILSARQEPLPLRQDLQLSERFRQSVESSFSKQWSISRYAKELHTSSSTLNRACLKYLGISAKKYLQERMHTEAKRLLIYTNESLDEIAWQLGYKDASYFSKVFRSNEGCSPRDFRKKMTESIDLVTNQ